MLHEMGYYFIGYFLEFFLFWHWIALQFLWTIYQIENFFVDLVC
jgi:hypothetical protein